MFDTTEALHILPFALAADFDDVDDDVQVSYLLLVSWR